MRITDRAKAEMAHHVAQLRDSSDDGGIAAERLVDDIKHSYALICDNPSVGESAGAKAYPNARMVGLANFNSYLIIFDQDEDGVLVVGLILSWMTGL